MMKNSYIIVAIVMLSLGLFSCTTESISDIQNDEIETLATEGEDGDILPDEGD